MTAAATQVLQNSFQVCAVRRSIRPGNETADRFPPLPSLGPQWEEMFQKQSILLMIGNAPFIQLNNLRFRYTLYNILGDLEKIFS